jgi:phosphotransferase system HPr (HPr) family protein
MCASSDPPPDEADLPLSAPERGTGGEVRLAVKLPADVALHARPAAELVRAASHLQAQVTISANGRRANARSILEVLALGATGGSELTIGATGPGAADAVRTLAEVVAGLG